MAAKLAAELLHQLADVLDPAYHIIADLDRVLLDLGVSAATCSKLLQQVARKLAFVLAAPSSRPSMPQQY